MANIRLTEELTLSRLPNQMMRQDLRLNGISEKDVTILPVGDEGGRLNALQTGRIDAAMCRINVVGKVLPDGTIAFQKCSVSGIGTLVA